VHDALNALIDRADAVRSEGSIPLTDPLLELWLERHAAM
jgi:hypothetical protein